MSSSSVPRCPACRAAAEPRTKNDAFPFCSRACKLADLGRWLDGSYRVPGDPIDVSDVVGRPPEDDQPT